MVQVHLKLIKGNMKTEPYNSSNIYIGCKELIYSSVWSNDISRAKRMAPNGVFRKKSHIVLGPGHLSPLLNPPQFIKH